MPSGRYIVSVYVWCTSTALAGVLLISMSAGAARASSQGQARHLLKIRVSEASLRRMAVKTVLPTFPDAAERHGDSGVAVARVDVNPSGKVGGVKVLQSPDASIARAVASALKQWVFRPQKVSGQGVAVEGKLTFYYLISHGRGAVLDPDQMPAKN